MDTCLYNQFTAVRGLIQIAIIIIYMIASLMHIIMLRIYWQNAKCWRYYNNII